jgi:hypothetical protein
MLHGYGQTHASQSLSLIVEILKIQELRVLLNVNGHGGLEPLTSLRSCL